MSKSNKIDEIMLASFVDGQLDAENREAIINAMDKDEDLRERVYNLRRTKDLIKLSFGNEKPPGSIEHSYTPTLRSQCLKKVAAAFTALAVGLGAGFTGYQYCSHTGHIMSSTDLAELTQLQGQRIILHISESDPVQFEKTLAYTENLHEGNSTV